jgi:hypothetical protein
VKEIFAKPPTPHSGNSAQNLLHTSCDRDRRDLTPSEIGSLEAREGQGVGRFRSYLDEDGAG